MHPHRFQESIATPPASQTKRRRANASSKPRVASQREARSELNVGPLVPRHVKGFMRCSGLLPLCVALVGEGPLTYAVVLVLVPTGGTGALLVLQAAVQ